MTRFTNLSLVSAEADAAPGGKLTAPNFPPAGGIVSDDLDRARGIVAHPAGHSDAKIAEACRTLIERSKRHEDHVCALELIGMLEV